MKRSNRVGVQDRKRNLARSGKLWQLDCLEPRLLLSTVTVSPVLVTEGNATTNATLTARLDKASSSNTILQYATRDATAKAGLDYTAASSFVVIPAGATSKSFTIPILANNVYQGLTSFLVNMSVSGGNKLSQRQTAVYIQDNDAAPQVLMHDVTVTATNATQTVNVPVTLTALSLQPVTVTYTTYNVTAVAGTDYAATSGKVTFAPGQWYKTIPVQVLPASGGDKAFDVMVGTATNATLASQWVYGRVAIQNGVAATKPTVTVESATVEAGGYEQFHVSLSQATTEPVSFRYQSYPPTAGGGTITAVDGTFTLAAGSTSGTIYVRTHAGTGTADADFPLLLTAPANATLGASAAWGKIVSVPPTLSVADTSVVEGNSGTTAMVFTVTLSSASTEAVSVDYATADITGVTAIPAAPDNEPAVGTPYPYAHAGSDYVATSGTLTFAPGETSKTITVLVDGDTTIERNEPLDLVLSNASHATIARGTAVGTILNDDFASLSVASASVTEDAGNNTPETLTFTVTLSSVSPFPVTVHYATSDGTAAAGTDYTATSGTLTFAAGETSKTIDVAVSGNTVAPTETLNLTLSNATSATIGTGTAVGTINSMEVLSDNTDMPAANSIWIENTQWQAANFSTDGGGDLQSVTVPLEQFISGPLTMKIYTDNGGVPGTVVGTLTSPGSFSVGSAMNATFTASGITLAANTTYWVALETNTGAFSWSYAFGSGGEGSGFIGGQAVTYSGDSGWAAGSYVLQMQVITRYSGPAVSIAPASVTEEVGNNSTQTLNYTVTLSSAATFPVTVHYATSDGTAAAGTDYTATSGTLTFAAGETSKTIAVTVTGNTLEADETLNMTLSGASNATLGTAVGVGTIGSVTDVSDNLSESSIGNELVMASQWFAGQFQTTNSATLSSVTIPMGELSPGGAVAMIYSDNAGNPGTLVGTLTSPASFPNSTSPVTFTGNGIALSAGTTYWVVVQGVGAGTYGWSRDNSSNGSGAGFVVSNPHFSSNNGASWATDPGVLQMQVLVSP